MGGGAGGGSSITNNVYKEYGGAGGAGGYTMTLTNIIPRAGVEYPIVIGAGGVANAAGGTTSAFGSQVDGGSALPNNVSPGGSGQCGGGGGGHGSTSDTSKLNGGAGGSDGGNGGAGYYGGGSGNGATTREFGESTGKLYAGGGGGGGGSVGYRYHGTGGAGGAGGGGKGGDGNETPPYTGYPGEDGEANTGGGGGGRGASSGDGAVAAGGAGGSGIVCIRLHKKNEEKLDFTYTGDYTEREDSVVELKSSGSFTLNKDTIVDIFCVGGGGKGGDSTVEYRGGGGGGGGYTKTIRSLSLKAHTPYSVVIGAGSTQSSPVPSSEPLVHGGTTKFETFIEAIGGVSAVSSGWKGNVNGAAGGSGGGAGVYSEYSQSTGGQGGSDGSNGEAGKSFSTGEQAIGGVGQGTTTREFGEPNGKLYAGGGGGGRHVDSSTLIISPGGFGGGGAGGFCNGNGNVKQAPVDGEPNTGGGGGGTARGNSFGTWGGPPAKGGSGICCIRKAAPLPELAGTWVLNERLYAPEFGPSATGKQTSQAVTFTAGSDTFTSFVFFWPSVNDNNMYYQNSAKTIVIYNFVSNTYYSGVIKTITFPEDATASDEFRAWLLNNAVKQ